MFIRTLYGLGLNDCDPPLIPVASAADYAAGLRGLRDHLTADSTRFGIYVLPGPWHICFQDSCFDTTEVAGTRLNAWVGDVLSGTVRNVGLE